MTFRELCIRCAIVEIESGYVPDIHNNVRDPAFATKIACNPRQRAEYVHLKNWTGLKNIIMDPTHSGQADSLSQTTRQNP